MTADDLLYAVRGTRGGYLVHVRDWPEAEELERRGLIELTRWSGPGNRWKRAVSSRRAPLRFELHLPGDLGAALRSLRRERRSVTLEALRVETGLSVPYLSQVERADRYPSVQSLLALVRAHGSRLVIEEAEVP